jgi:hypothetical protein
MALSARAVPGAPWYRQFWPWFLIAVPALSVLGGVAAVVVAVRNADSVVRDDWYAHGLSINVDLARDRVAAELGIRATVSLDERAREIRVALAGPAMDADRMLDLELSHPTRADRDRTLRAVRGADGAYRAPVTGDPGDLQGRWNAILGPATGAWRLAGPIELAPGVEAPLEPRS